MREGISRKAPCRAEGVNFRKSNEAQIVELECAWSKRQLPKEIIKAIIRKQKMDLFCIQEMKIQTKTEGVVRSLGIGRFLDWRALDASGSVGGILICWDKRTLEILDLEVGQFSISCRFRKVEDGFV